MEPQDRRERLTKVILIGGAPLAGKTTLARYLAARLGFDHLLGDDLTMAARPLAPEPLRATLEPMRGYDWREYYLVKTLDEQIEGALAAHRGLWPAIEPIINARATWGRPAVIDWWGFLPEVVRTTWPNSMPGIAAIWIHVEPALFAARLELDVQFYRGAKDERELIEAFAARSRHFNEYYRSEAQKHGFPVLSIAHAEDVAPTANRALALIGAKTPGDAGEVN